MYPRNKRILDYQLSYCEIETSKPTYKYVKEYQSYTSDYIDLPGKSEIFYIFISESEREVLGFMSFLKLVESKSMGETYNIIEKYSGDVWKQVINYFGEKITEIAALLLWADMKYSVKYGEPELGIVLDSSTNKPLFLVLTFPKCKSNEWDKLVTSIKHVLRSAGLKELTSMVAIICAKGLEEELTD